MNTVIRILLVCMPFAILVQAQPVPITLKSSAFNNNEPIPEKYTCSGNGFSPQLSWNTVADAKSYVLLVEDPDAPVGRYTHWIVYNIPAQLITVTEQIATRKSDEVIQGALGIPENMSGHEIGALEGINSSGKPGYVPPCPPMGTHRYYFTIYALDTVLNLPDHASKEAVERAMQNHIIGKGSLVGTFRKEE